MTSPRSLRRAPSGWSTLRSIQCSRLTVRRSIDLVGGANVPARGLKLVALSLLLGGTTVLLSGCSWSDALALGWPKGITPEAHLNRELWIGSMIAALVVGAIVYVMLFWTVVFHRKKKGEQELPRQFGYNMPLELALTVTP